MGNISIVKLFEDLYEAADFFQKVASNENVELWKVSAGRYAIVSRVKKRGRNPKINLTSRLDGKCPECGRPAVAVWEKGDAKALKCLKGHQKKNSAGRRKTIHPVYLI